MKIKFHGITPAMEEEKRSNAIYQKKNRKKEEKTISMKKGTPSGDFPASQYQTFVTAPGLSAKGRKQVRRQGRDEKNRKDFE